MIETGVAPNLTTPAYWQGVLERSFGKRNPRLSWLELHWDPRWARWVIYQMVPQEVTNWFVRIDPEDGTTDLHMEMDLLSSMQQKIFLETGCFGSPLWIIQGSHGGHRRRYWPYEAALAGMQGYPEEPPLPGELPFAPMGWNVIEQLHELDQVSKWNKMLEYCDRNAATLDADDRSAERKVKLELGKWITKQVANVYDATTLSMRSRIQDELPHGRSRKGGIDLDQYMESRLN